MIYKYSDIKTFWLTRLTKAALQPRSFPVCLFSTLLFWLHLSSWTQIPAENSEHLIQNKLLQCQTDVRLQLQSDWDQNIDSVFFFFFITNQAVDPGDLIVFCGMMRADGNGISLQEFVWFFEQRHEAGASFPKAHADLNWSVCVDWNSNTARRSAGVHLF